MSKHFLYLTNDKLVTLLWKSGTIIGRDVFIASEAASPAFHEYLAKHRHVPTYLVVDLIEEDFRLDSMPHLRGGDADAVMERKLGQLYRATHFRHAIVQEREPEGRRDDKVLYHAVTNPELLKRWLAALEMAKVPLEGVYSSPVLSLHLLNQLDVIPAHALVVTIAPDFGLRQTYFQNKLIKFSRLTQIIFDEGQSVGSLIAAETSRTWQYLDSLRFFSTGDTLEVCILVHERDRPMIAEAIRSYPLLNYRFLDIAEIAQKIKLKPVPTSSHAEEILTHLYAQNRLENHFAEPAARRFALFRRARIGLYAFTVAVLATGVAGTAFNLYQAGQISNEIDKREVVSRNLRSEYQSISAVLREQKLASDTVRDTSIFFNSQIRPLPAAPGGFLREISGVIADTPNVRLLQVVWAVGNDANALPYFMPMPTQATLEVTSSDAKSAAVVNAASANQPNSGAGIATSPQAVAEVNPALPGNKFHIGVMELAITPFEGDFRKLLKDIESFKSRLNQIPGVKATVVTLPLNIDSSATLRAGSSKSGKETRDARFAIKVVSTVVGT